jgi:hypothetical protein
MIFLNSKLDVIYLIISTRDLFSILWGQKVTTDVRKKSNLVEIAILLNVKKFKLH